MSIVLALIAALSWIRFFHLGFTTRGGLTDQSVVVPILWTILAVVA